MGQMLQYMGILKQEFTLNVGNFHMPVPYWQAVAVVSLLFILVLTMAQFRRHYIDWSFKGGVAGVFFGFLLALILEGFLLIGGKTALTEVLGWENAPKPIGIALDAGRTKLIQVLGIQDQIPTSLAKENNTITGTIEAIQSLNPADLKKVKNLICTP
jgi:hypothetical protein